MRYTYGFGLTPDVIVQLFYSGHSLNAIAKTYAAFYHVSMRQARFAVERALYDDIKSVGFQ